MTVRLYMRTIVPIGLMFSLSLSCGNLAYLYLSVSFIQMLKVRAPLLLGSATRCRGISSLKKVRTDFSQATMPVVTLLVSWALRVVPPSLTTLGNVSFIVFGIIIASYGEIQFVLTGFINQAAAILFEAVRLVLVQKLLSGDEFEMDPLVSLYYFAPVCVMINGTIALVVELPRMTIADVENVGYCMFLINALIAFALNVSSVFLVSLECSSIITMI